jgi:hypothetical protein
VAHNLLKAEPVDTRRTTASVPVDLQVEQTMKKVAPMRHDIQQVLSPRGSVVPEPERVVPR